MLDEKGNPLREITIRSPKELIPEPVDMKTFYLIDLRPDGATFDPPALLTMAYDTAWLPEDVSQHHLTIVFYNPETGTWEELGRKSVDPVNHRVRGDVGHFTFFAVMGPAPIEWVPASSPSPTSPAEESDSPVKVPLIAGTIVAVGSFFVTMFMFLMSRRRAEKSG